MPADNARDQLDRWLDEQVQPLPPPAGTFELIVKRARRRKLRKAVVSVASAAAVAAAVGVAVPVGLSLRLTPAPTDAGLAAGPARTPSSVAGSQTTLSQGTSSPDQPRPAASARSSAAATADPASPVQSGYLPPDYVPSSVTWDSTSTGWVLGPAGTPGKCANANPDICTSIARTSDGGRTWQGLPAPDAPGPESATGVTGLRFLNASYGWAFGPDLFATTDGGRSWHRTATGTAAVTDLETASNRAYALFGNCTPPAGTTGDTIANCTSYTLKTTVAGSDNWTPVGGVPANLTAAGGTASGGAQRGSALLQLAGATGTTPATGYLVAPDGTLYSGPLDGTAWHRDAKLPCTPGTAANDGLPSGIMLAPDGTTAAGTTRLAAVCAPTAADTVVYLSTDNGATWAVQSPVGAQGTAHVGTPQSLTTLPDGTLILATTPSQQAAGGIYRLLPGATQWQAAALSDKSGKTHGFTYVGMTSATQGVALGGDPNLHAIWMTTDGGQTWQVRKIQSG